MGFGVLETRLIRRPFIDFIRVLNPELTFLLGAVASLCVTVSQFTAHFFLKQANTV